MVSGTLYDILFTLPTADPFLNLYRDDTGVIRLPEVAAFGLWQNAVDLMPASNADIGRDTCLAPMAEPLSAESVEFFFHASRSWEDARDYLVELSAGRATWERTEDCFEIAEDAIRWGLLRRKAYGVHRDEFFLKTVPAWAARATRIVNDEPFDEGRMWRLRTGAEIPEGTYERLARADVPCGCDEPGCTGGC
ncbi:hypothetical protein [Homoserinimonas sp. A520]